MNKSIIKKILIIVLLLTVMLVVIYASNRFLQIETIDQNRTPAKSYYYGISAVDEQADATNAVLLSTKDAFGDVLIDAGGEYIIAGKINGRIVINTDGSLVHLYLDNADVESFNGPALLVQNAGKVVVTSLSETQNVFKDTNYGLETGIDACIFSESDIVFNGNGNLRVYGYYSDAIFCRDIIKFVNTDAEIYAISDGICANDGILIKDSNVSVQAKKNGILTLKKGKNNRGAIEIDGSYLSAVAGIYAVNSSGDIAIRNSKGFLKGVAGKTFSDKSTYIEEDFEDYE